MVALVVGVRVEEREGYVGETEDEGIGRCRYHVVFRFPGLDNHPLKGNERCIRGRGVRGERSALPGGGIGGAVFAHRSEIGRK